MHIAPSEAGSSPETKTPTRPGWKAELTLRFRRTMEGSVLAHRRHMGPLVVQKCLYPEGRHVAHAVVVHPPGGIAGGDLLSIGVGVEQNAHALVTTPAATKWYKADGASARQDGLLTVESAGILEWLPLENIVFDAARAAMTWRVDLAEAAVFAGWDITCLGRRAAGEAFLAGSFHQATHVYRAGRQIWGDLIALRGNDPLLQSVVGLGGNTVFGSMIVANGETPGALVDRCRAIQAQGQGGVTALPEIFAARYLGQSAEHAKAYFGALWRELRPWYAARAAHRPRIWDT